MTLRFTYANDDDDLQTDIYLYTYIYIYSRHRRMWNTYSQRADVSVTITVIALCIRYCALYFRWILSSWLLCIYIHIYISDDLKNNQKAYSLIWTCFLLLRLPNVSCKMNVISLRPINELTIQIASSHLYNDTLLIKSVNNIAIHNKYFQYYYYAEVLYMNKTKKFFQATMPSRHNYLTTNKS